MTADLSHKSFKFLWIRGNIVKSSEGGFPLSLNFMYVNLPEQLALSA